MLLAHFAMYMYVILNHGLFLSKLKQTQLPLFGVGKGCTANEIYMYVCSSKSQTSPSLIGTEVKGVEE